MTFIQKYHICFFIFVSAILTIFTGYFSSNIAKVYYQNNYYSPDPSGNLIHNIELHHEMQKKNKWHIALNEFKENRNNPLMTIPLLILSPDLLANKNGHLLIFLPFYFLFLLFLSILVYQYTNHLFFSSAFIIFFTTTLVLYAPYFGVGFNLPDSWAPYSLGLSAISLINWHHKNKFHWFCFFVIFSCLAILSRYITVVYALVIFLPIICGILYSRYKVNAKWFDKLNYFMLISAAITLFITLFFLIIHLKSNYEYYSYWKSLSKVTMNYPWHYSLYSFIYNYLGFFGLPHTIIIGLHALLITALCFKQTKTNKSDFLIRCWYLLALPLFWIFILKVNGFKVSSIFLIYFPITFVALTPWCILNVNENLKRIMNIYALVMILFASYSFMRSYHKTSSWAVVQTGGNYETKKIQSHAALLLSSFNNDIILTDLITGGYLATGIRIETYYQHKKYIGELNFKPFLPSFSNEKINPSERAEDIVSNSNFIVIDNRFSGKENSDFANPFNAKLKTDIFTKLYHYSDSQWQLIDSLTFNERNVYFFHKHKS